MQRDEQAIKAKLQKLIDKMNELGYKAFQIDRLKKLVDELEQVGMYGLARFVNKSIEIIKDKHQYFDVEKEGRFAILLAKSCLHRAHQYLMGLRTYIAHPKYSRPYLRYSSWAL